MGRLLDGVKVNLTHWLISTQLLTASTLLPPTLASPDVGSMDRQIIDTVVVFPAPFAPSKPKTWPVGTPKAAHWTDSTAEPPKNRGGYIFRRSETTRPSRSAGAAFRDSDGGYGSSPGGTFRSMATVSRTAVENLVGGGRDGGASSSGSSTTIWKSSSFVDRASPALAASPAPVSAATRARSAATSSGIAFARTLETRVFTQASGRRARRSLKMTIPS